MSNQKISELRRLTSPAVGDLIPIVDVSDTSTAPTGETKKILAGDFGNWLVTQGIVDLSLPYQASQTSNGLHFDESFSPNGVAETHCYTKFPNLGDDFTVYIRGFVPSDFSQTSTPRALISFGPSPTNMVGQANSATIGIIDDHLFGQIYDGVTNDVLYVTNFFTKNKNKVFGASISKNILGEFKLVVNGGYIISSSAGATYGIANEYLSMGCGRDDSFNIESTIYEAHIFNAMLTDSASAELFYGGSNLGNVELVASYIPNNLTQSPGQWLDCKGNHHILLSTTGSNSTNPKKDFSLRFYSTGSGFLGDGSSRDVLPSNYVLTSCIVESDYKPLLAIGSSATPSVPGSSGTGSWYDNRVPFTSASYGINDLGLLALGVAHKDRTLYAAFSGSEYPCTFSFEGYIR
jgi:hypothetical protein